MPLRARAVTYCLLNISNPKQRRLVQCLLVTGSDIAEHTDAHCHGNGCNGCFVQWRRHSVVYCMSVLCMCMYVCVYVCLWSWGSFSCLHTRTRRCWMHQTGQSSCCCPLCHSHSHYASLSLLPLICQSLTTVASLPLSPYFSSSFPSSSCCFLLPVLPPCLSELLIIYLLLPSLLLLLHFLSLFLSFALTVSLLSLSLPLSSPLPLFLLQPQCSSVWIAGMLL